ncbi:unnamed protein product [Notodromas monacha]|uniref:Stathmin n=1 Tax=Notodromas monacha TaxID=399045 RepID=A0A7R9BKE1_9CRUS|nr:unnamed protein product [Notodromas monacha]CAG0916858.1 unnamed protein product [Notodromas monacha]
MDCQNVRVLKETNNAVSMEVVLAQPSSPKPAIASAEKSLRSHTEIVQKLEAAEKRRSLKLEQRANVGANISNMEEVHARKAVLHGQFISATKEALDSKLEGAEEKRVKTLEELKQRVKERLDKIAEIKHNKENSAENLKLSIEEKIKAANENRDQNLQSMVARLKNHLEKVAQANATQTEELLALRAKIDQQLQNATENRAAELLKIKKLAQDEEKRVEQARLKKGELNSSNAQIDMEA